MIAKKLTDLIGNTPMLELSSYVKNNNLESNIIAKLEYFNPLGSVKDRVAFAMIKDAEDKGLITKDTVIIEPTSGNTGIGLAFVAAAKSYRLILTMPETMSIERRQLLSSLGAELVLTPGNKGMKGAIEKAQILCDEISNSYMPQQFKNHSNVEIHKKTTAQEIMLDTEGNIDVFVAGVGTGGTISGVGEVLKAYNNDIKIVAVEPENSPVISKGTAGPHKIQGIGAGFIPDILNTKIIDQVVLINDEEAKQTAQELAKTEGLVVGISSGAAVCAAKKIAKDYVGKNIVVLLPDTGQRYLSTGLFSSE